MTTSNIPDHNGDALDRLLQQYKGKTFIEGMITALFTNQTQEEEDALRDFYDRLDIDSQEGTQLDNIGDLVGQARLGFDDATYRILLRARIGRNVSEGGIERVITSWKLLTGASIVQLLENYPAEIELYSDVPISIDLLVIALELMNETIVAGVSLGAVGVYTPGASFGFDGNDDALGFGDATDTSLGGSFSYIQTVDSLVIISDPLIPFGFDGILDPTITGFSSITNPTVGGKLSYIET